MSVKFKVIEWGQPGVVGGGDKKFYATASLTGEMTLEALTKQIERVSIVNGADIRAVLYAMVEIMQDALENGQAVRLGELGSLRVSIGSKGEVTEEDVTSHSIRGAKTIFTPGKDLKKMLNNLSFEKI